MTVAQPVHLLIMNESAGSSITNYGSDGTAFTEQHSAVENTGFAWHQDQGLYDGFYEGILAGGAIAYWSPAATTPGSSFVNINFATRFQLQSLNNARACICSEDPAARGLKIEANDDGAGGFDLSVSVRSTIQLGPPIITFSGLSFATDYSLAVAFLGSDITVAEVRAKLDSAAVVSSGTRNQTGESLPNANPIIGQSDDWTAERGFDGYIYYWTYGRNQTSWSDADLADINSNPAATITGWPGTGVTIAAGFDALTITELGAGVALDVGVDAAFDTLTITEQQASVQLSKSIAAAIETLTITELGAAVSLDVDVQAAVEALSIMEFAAAISQGSTVQAAADSLGLTVLVADIALDAPIAAGLDTLTVTELQAVVRIQTQGEINAGFDALTITELRAVVEGVGDGGSFRITTGYMWT